MSLAKLFLVVCALIGAWHLKGALVSARGNGGFPASIASESQTVSVVGNAFIHRVDDAGVPELTLKFLDSHRVQMTNRGKPFGPMCTYAMSGREITLKHACGVWHMEVRSGALYLKKDDWTFERVK